MLQHDGAGRSNRVPMLAVAAMADVSRQVLYEMLDGGRALSKHLCSRLDAILTAIENGELRFRRVGQVWEAEWLTPPNPLPPPQDRMVPAGDFVEWARCRSCGGRHFTLVTLHGAPALWYLCDTCTWWETAGLGAKRAVVKKARRR